MRARISLLLSFLLLIFSASSFASYLQNQNDFCKQKKTFDLNGSFFLRTESSNKGILSEKGITLIRTRTRTIFNPMSNTQIFLAPQFSYKVGASSGGIEKWGYDVHEAFLAYSPSKNIAFKLGRQILSYGDQLVIGSLDWNVVGRTFDAVKMHMSYGNKKNHWIDFFATQLDTGNLESVILGKVGSGKEAEKVARLCSGKKNNFKDGLFRDSNYLFGLYNHTDFGFHARNVDFYIFNKLDANIGIEKSLWILGSRVKSKINNFDYRMEVTYQYGSEINDYQIDTEFGYAFKAANIRISIEGFLASDGYNQLYPTGHKFLGLMDLFARKNVYGLSSGIAINGCEKLILNFKHHSFFRTGKSKRVYRLNGKVYEQERDTEIIESSNIGSEFDLLLNYQISNKLKAEAAIGLFLPHRLMSSIGVKGLQKFGYIQLVANF